MIVVRGLVGVVHLAGLPGDPANDGATFEDVLARARVDAEALVEGGADAVLVENFGSAPFAKGTRGARLEPHAVTALALAVRAVRDLDVPVGVNCLRNDARSAIGIAAAAGAAFVRVNVHTGAYVTDQGVIEGEAFDTLRYRSALGADHVAILADVLVKHAAPLAALTPEAATREALERGLADGVIVTGEATGAPVDEERLARVRAAAGDAPVFVGSGMTPERAATLGPLADGAIAGTWLKRNGDVRAEVDVARVRELVKALRGRFRG